jgi:hypothetical protein
MQVGLAERGDEDDEGSVVQRKLDLQAVPAGILAATTVLGVALLLL